MRIFNIKIRNFKTIHYLKQKQIEEENIKQQKIKEINKQKQIEEDNINKQKQIEEDNINKQKQQKIIEINKQKQIEEKKIKVNKIIEINKQKQEGIIRIKIVGNKYRINKFEKCFSNLLGKYKLVDDNYDYILFCGFGDIPLTYSKYENILKYGFDSKFITINTGLNKSSYRISLGSYAYNHILYREIERKRIKYLLKTNKCELLNNWNINKNGIILICTNNSKGWYKDKFNPLNLEKMINIIRKNSNLKIEIRLHPKDRNEEMFDIIQKKYNLELNHKPLKEIYNNLYCAIVDKSSVATNFVLNNILVFNYCENNENKIVDDIFITDFSLLNPNNLEISCLPNKKTYIKKIFSTIFMEDELFNGYAFNELYNFLLENCH